MNGLLAIAERFLDHMTNPRYGPEENEEYSLRFHQALAQDPDFAGNFASLVLRPDDVDALPIGAWQWYLLWRAQEAGPPPSPAFLDALFDATDDPGVRLAVLQSAFSATDEAAADSGDDIVPPDPGGASPGAPLPDEVPARAQSRWLRTRIARSANDPDPARVQADAAELAVYLLQLGDEASLDSLAALLATRWAGQPAIRAAIEAQLDGLGPDTATAAAWRRRLRLDDGGQQPRGNGISPQPS